MVRTAVKVLVIDVVLLLAVFQVASDLQNRASCVLGHSLYGQFCLARSSPVYSYTLFTQFLSMISGGTMITSPSTLDWVQLLVAVLIAVNLWFIYKTLTVRSGGPRPPTTSA